MNVCVHCNTNPVHVQMYGLCSPCYRSKRGQGTLKAIVPFRTPPKEKAVTSKRRFRELEFVKNFFDHDDWIAQPAKFNLGNGETYRPDFYDMRSRTFIEVAGTRQAYHYSKDKYKLFTLVYPDLKFEVRKPNGELYETRPRTKGDEQSTLEPE